jgi:hypothetical protein
VGRHHTPQDGACRLHFAYHLLRVWQSSVPTGSRHVARPTNACVGEHRAR